MADGNKEIKKASAVFLDVPKTAPKSRAYQAMGDEHFKNREKKDGSCMLSALMLYNSAFNIAPTNSRGFYACLINRTSIYYFLKMYDVCIENIELIYKYGLCPSDYLDHMKIIEEACKKHVSNKKHVRVFEPIEPELSLPCNEENPFVAKCLEMPDKHIITNRDLKVGDIIAILEPDFIVKSERHQCQRCENCCKENNLNLMTCPGCATAMYCSENCYETAMATYHQYECRFVCYFNRHLKKEEKLALRVMMSGLSCFDSIDEFVDYSVDAFNKDTVKLHETLYSVKDKYRSVCSLSNAVKTPILPVESTALMTFLAEIISVNISPSGKKPYYHKMLNTVVERHLLIAEQKSTNFVNFSDKVVSSRAKEDNRKHMLSSFNPAIYLFTTFLKHSCVPNVILTTAGTRIVVSVVRPIKAGEPLLVCTKKQYFEQSREERVKELGFECQCIACTENYPMLQDLPLGSLSYPHYFDSDITKLLHYDRVSAQSHYDIIVNKMQNNDSDMPCRKLAYFNIYYANIMNAMYLDELSILLRICETIVKKY